MVRILALALLLAAAGAAAAVTPASADDSGSVRAQMAELATQAARNDAALARLNLEIADRQRSIDQERLQLKVLARALYEQPESPLQAVAQAPNLSDALTRAGDLYVAAYRARSLKVELDADVRALAGAQAKAVAERQRLADERQALDLQYQRLLVLEASSTAPATAAPPATFTGAVPDIIRQAWAPLGAARAEWAIRLAQCESGLNPYSVNRSSGASGLFQFLPSTWAGTPWRAQSPFDPSANASAAAWLYSRYGAGQWSCTARVGA